MVTAARSTLLGFNWPAEPVSLWVETQTQNCDQSLTESLPHLPTFQNSSGCVCERVCVHMYMHICTLWMSMTCVSLIKACWLSSLFQRSGLVPPH